MRLPDTAPIRPEERFDEKVVASYLRNHVPELVRDNAIVFDQFPGGKANLTYRAKAGETELVLRRAPLGQVASGGHDMEREFRVLSGLWREYPLAPRAFHFCGDSDVMGKPFFVMERRYGHVPRDSWPATWPEDDLSLPLAAARSLVASLGDLHLIDPRDVGLGHFGHPDGFVERQVAGWARRWDAARTREVPEMERAAGLLQRRLPRPQGASVLHNDFKLDNTMLGDDGQVVAVFDWDMSTRGDPLVDVGTMLAYWAESGAPTYPILGGKRAVTPAPFLSREDLLEQYASATGFDVSDIRFYEGLALYRITVIIEQIYARFAAGQTTDLRFAAFESLVPILAVAALDVLAKRA
jgi:aminoglycoside phosphotransferase (APT) family kinase protein